uniref:Ig-like domain-containing protein n=1 Tax=Seriola dumerili TaxID=41447 RepID=A0A3B4UKA6_SERDU
MSVLASHVQTSRCWWKDHQPRQNAPKLLSVSVSPSGEIVEGSSVNLTCSSDANPAANYTWYKENEDSPKASGQIFTITDLRPEHSGNYYCEAQNTRGRRNSTLNLTVVAGELHTFCVRTPNTLSGLHYIQFHAYYTNLVKPVLGGKMMLTASFVMEEARGCLKSPPIEMYIF